MGCNYKIYGSITLRRSQDVEALRRFAVRRTYRRGKTLFRQGDRPGEIMILERGEIELVDQNRGERLVVEIVHPGSSIDHLALILGVAHCYSAVALTDATVLRLRLDTVRGLAPCRHADDDGLFARALDA